MAPVKQPFSTWFQAYTSRTAARCASTTARFMDRRRFRSPTKDSRVLFQITNLFRGLSVYENLRLSLQAHHPARFNAWNDIDTYAGVHAETTELIRYLGLEGIEQMEAGEMSYGGQRVWSIMGLALGCRRVHVCCCSMSRSPGSLPRNASASLERSVHERSSAEIPGADRGARHRSRAPDLAHRVTVMNRRPTSWWTGSARGSPRRQCHGAARSTPAPVAAHVAATAGAPRRQRPSPRELFAVERRRHLLRQEPHPQQRSSLRCAPSARWSRSSAAMAPANPRC